MKKYHFSYFYGSFKADEFWGYGIIWVPEGEDVDTFLIKEYAKGKIEECSPSTVVDMDRIVIVSLSRL